MTAKEAVEFGIVDKIVEKRADAGVAGAGATAGAGA
jgi:ATP-dependent protease ClpP protease subunit